MKSNNIFGYQEPTRVNPCYGCISSGCSFCAFADERYDVYGREYPRTHTSNRFSKGTWAYKRANARRV